MNFLFNTRNKTRKEKVFLLKTALHSLLIACVLIFCLSCEKKKPETVITESPIQQAAANQTPTVRTDPTLTVQTNPTPTVGLEIGDIAPDLNLKDSNDTYIRLWSLRKKLVLIDFWASWCKPCKIENKNLVNVYKNYKDTMFKMSHGFDIYMVSVDDKREFWIKSLIQEGNYNWKYNLLDDGGGATWAYNVTLIPKNFLIDTNGIIIAKDLRDTIVEKTLIQLLK